MVKPIKFNLILDKYPIRDMEDMREHFNIEDLLEAFNNGSLKRWLEVRELKEAKELESIKGDDFETAMQLCRIFMQENCSKETLASAVYPFEFRKKEREKLETFKHLQEQKNEIIQAYHGGYEKLVNDMEARSGDYPFLKTAVKEIFKTYAGLYRLNMRNFYGRFINDHPLVILAIIANSNMRMLLPKKLEAVYKDMDISALTRRKYRKNEIVLLLEKWQTDKGQDMPEIKKCTSQREAGLLYNMNKDIIMLEFQGDHTLDKQVVTMKQLQSYARFPFTYVFFDELCTAEEEHIKTFTGETEGYWKDVEPKGKNILIIQMQEGNFIRNSGKTGEEMRAGDINGKFSVLDGIDYKSANASHKLIYMEI